LLVVMCGSKRLRWLVLAGYCLMLARNECSQMACKHVALSSSSWSIADPQSAARSAIRAPPHCRATQSLIA